MSLETKSMALTHILVLTIPKFADVNSRLFLDKWLRLIFKNSLKIIEGASSGTYLHIYLFFILNISGYDSTQI